MTRNVAFGVNLVGFDHARAESAFPPLATKQRTWPEVRKVTLAAFCTGRNKRALFEKPRWCPRQIDTISMAGMLIGDTNLSLVAVSSPRSNQPSAHVVARFHPLAQPPEAIRASRTRKSSRWRLALQTDCDSFSGPSSLKRLPNMLRISRARCRQTQRRYPARRGKLDHDHQLGGLSFDRRACDFALRLMGASLPISLNRPVTLR
jgi:hypothetical protein